MVLKRILPDPPAPLFKLVTKELYFSPSYLESIVYQCHHPLATSSSWHSEYYKANMNHFHLEHH